MLCILTEDWPLFQGVSKSPLPGSRLVLWTCNRKEKKKHIKNIVCPWKQLEGKRLQVRLPLFVPWYKKNACVGSGTPKVIHRVLCSVCVFSLSQMLQHVCLSSASPGISDGCCKHLIWWCSSSLSAFCYLSFICYMPNRSHSFETEKEWGVQINLWTRENRSKYQADAFLTSFEAVGMQITLN